MIYASVLHQIVIFIRRVLHEKNPYFYLIDWQPPQPRWLSPKEVGSLLAQHVPLAVCRNVQANCYGTVTKEEAKMLPPQVVAYLVKKYNIEL